MFENFRQIQLNSTVWKFHEFSINQILREINFGNSRSAKSAVFAIFEALNFVTFGEFQPSKRANFHEIENLQSICVKKGRLCTSRIPKIDFI